MDYRIIEHARPYLDRRLIKRLSRMFGKNERNEPLVTLEWGGTAMRFLAGMWRPKYQRFYGKPRKMLVNWLENDRNGQYFKIHPPSKVAPIPNLAGHMILPLVEEHDECDPYWYLVEWLPPEKLGDTPQGWEAKRYLNVGNKRIDMIGEFPSNGRYQPVMKLADENGEFLSSDDGRIMNLVEGYKNVRDECDKRKGHWREYLSQTELEQIARDSLYAIQKQKEREQAELREIIANEIAPVAHKILNNPRVYLDGAKIMEQ